MQIAKQIPYNEAHKLTKDNAFRIYANTAKNGTSGYERIVTGDFPQIEIKPKFMLDKTKPVFTIGSCFARNVEFFLEKSGVDCLTTKFLVPGEYYELTGHGARNGALNAYTPHSMRDIITLNNRNDAQTAGLLQVGDDEYFDMMVSGIKPLDAKDSSIVRNMVLNAYDSLSKASTVIITLGYTESWFDTEDKLYINRSPGGSIKTARKGNRYNFYNIDAAETTRVLDEIIEAIALRTANNAKIILTVSPVPLHGTFTDKDVIAANLYSKCTLLSAAVETASKYDHVDYYPSYEMVTYSNRDTSWEEDGIHVKPHVVEKVISTFGTKYFGAA